MRRAIITKNRYKTGRWFDLDRAECYRDDVDTDCRYHTYLYLTAGGAWVLNHWSMYQGSVESYEIATDAQAIDFLVDNGHFYPGPACNQKIIEAIAARELK